MFSKIIPSFFTIKEGSTFLTKPLFPQEREDVTALSAISAPPVPPQREGPYPIPKPYIKANDRARNRSIALITLLPITNSHNVYSTIRKITYGIYGVTDCFNYWSQICNLGFNASNYSLNI